MVTMSPTLVHVRFRGRSEELDLAALELSFDATDADIRAALARHYDCAIAELRDYVIVREPEAIIVRPVAIYG